MVGGSKEQREPREAQVAVNKKSKHGSHKQNQTSKTEFSRTSAKRIRATFGSNTSLSKSSRDGSNMSTRTRRPVSAISSHYLWQEAIRNPNSDAFLKPPAPNMLYNKRNWVIELPEDEMSIRIPIESEVEASIEPWSASLPQIPLSKNLYFETKELKDTELSVKSQTALRSRSSQHRVRMGVSRKGAPTNQSSRQRLPSSTGSPLRSCLKQNEPKSSSGDTGTVARVHFHLEKSETEITCIPEGMKKKTTPSIDSKKSTDSGSIKSPAGRPFSDSQLGESPLEMKFHPTANFNVTAPDGMFRRVDVSKIRKSVSLRKLKDTRSLLVHSDTLQGSIPRLKQSLKTITESASENQAVGANWMPVDPNFRYDSTKRHAAFSDKENKCPIAANSLLEASENQKISTTESMPPDIKTDRIRLTSVIESKHIQMRRTSSMVQLPNANSRQKHTPKEKKGTAQTNRKRGKNVGMRRGFKASAERKITQRIITQICSSNSEHVNMTKNKSVEKDVDTTTKVHYSPTVESVSIDRSGIPEKVNEKSNNWKATLSEWDANPTNLTANSMRPSTLTRSTEGPFTDVVSNTTKVLIKTSASKASKSQIKNVGVNKESPYKTMNKYPTKPSQVLIKSDKISKNTAGILSKRQASYGKIASPVSSPLKFGKHLGERERSKQRDVPIQKTMFKMSKSKSYMVKTSKSTSQKLSFTNKDTIKTSKFRMRRTERIRDTKPQKYKSKLDTTASDFKTQRRKGKLLDTLKIEESERQYLAKTTPYRCSTKQTGRSTWNKPATKPKYTQSKRQIKDLTNKRNSSYCNTSKNIYERYQSKSKLNFKNISQHTLFPKRSKTKSKFNISITFSQRDNKILDNNTQGNKSVNITQVTRGKIYDAKSIISTNSKQKGKGEQDNGTVNIPNRSNTDKIINSRSPIKIDRNLSVKCKPCPMNEVNASTKKPDSLIHPMGSGNKESPNRSLLNQSHKRNSRSPIRLNTIVSRYSQKRTISVPSNTPIDKPGTPTHPEENTDKVWANITSPPSASKLTIRIPTKNDPKSSNNSKTSSGNQNTEKSDSVSNLEKKLDTESANNTTENQISECIPEEIKDLQETKSSSIFDCETCEQLRLMKAARESDWDVETTMSDSRYLDYVDHTSYYETYSETDDGVADFTSAEEDNSDKGCNTVREGKSGIARPSEKDSSTSSLETVKEIPKKKLETSKGRADTQVTGKTSLSKLQKPNDNTTSKNDGAAINSYRIKSNVMSKSDGTAINYSRIKSTAMPKNKATTRSSFPRQYTGVPRTAGKFQKDVPPIRSSQRALKSPTKFTVAHERGDIPRDSKRTGSKVDNPARNETVESEKGLESKDTLQTTSMFDIPILKEPSKATEECKGDNEQRPPERNVTVLYSNDMPFSDGQSVSTEDQRKTQQKYNSLRTVQGKRHSSNVLMDKRSLHPLFDPVTCQYRPPNNTAQRAEERVFSKKVSVIKQIQSNREAKRLDDAAYNKNNSKVLIQNTQNNVKRSVGINRTWK